MMCSSVHKLAIQVAVWAVVLAVAVYGQEPVAVADPNIDALRGLDLATLAGLQEAFGRGGGGGVPPPALTQLIASTRGGRVADGLGGTCGGSSPDSLTNLLVYQYLLGNLPDGGDAEGGPNTQGRSTTSAAALQALLQDRVESPSISTRTTVSTSLTTSTVIIDPTTRFITSSSTYTTTVTNIDTKVIPVIFRGSKVTTTFTESSTEVIVATEFQTSSTVVAPTIVQTLPVHITLTATSTRGFDGHFTLADLVPGASSVVQQPIATATFDLDAAGVLPSNLDLSNLDLSQYDLSSLGSMFGGSDQGQMVSALTALLEQYGNEPPKQISSRVSSTTRRKNNSRPGRKQESSPRSLQFDDDMFVDHEEPPKFNVIKGFTLSDRAPANSGPPRGGSGGGGGSAATATRYSKYHKKTDPDNNDLGKQATETDRESERYSASTSRRTISQANGRKVGDGPAESRRSPSSRFEPAEETQYYETSAFDRFRNNGKRNNREIESTNSRRKGDLEDNNTNTRNTTKTPAQRISSLKRFTSRGRPNSSLEKEVAAAQPDPNVQTTVLTMFVSGTAPGDFKKTFQTVTLRSFQANSRVRRHAVQNTQDMLSPSGTRPEETTTQLVDPKVQVNSLAELKPEQVVKMLKKLDPNSVKKMLKSLNKWVSYYTNELIKDEQSSGTTKSVMEVPELSSSLSVVSEPTSSDATTALPGAPSEVTHTPGAATPSSSSGYLCLPPSTVTETIYRTILVPVNN